MDMNETPKAANANPTAEAYRSFIHPASGLLILGADWFFFSGTVISLGGLLVHLMFFGFLAGFAGVTYIQRFVAGEPWQNALIKGLIAGVFVGFPIPIGGTIIGGLILACSGLDVLRQQAAQALAEKTAKAPAEDDEVQENEAG